MLVIAAAQCQGPEFAGRLIDGLWAHLESYGCHDLINRQVTLCDIADSENDWWWSDLPDTDDLVTTPPPEGGGFSDNLDYCRG